MSQTVAKILEEAEQLTTKERAELAGLLVESLARVVPKELAQAQISEVRRRVAQVETGEVALIPGKEALAHVRGIVASPRVAEAFIAAVELAVAALVAEERRKARI